MQKARKSTKFTFTVGYILILSAIGFGIAGMFVGAINQTNIVDYTWSLLLTSAATLGINLTRVAVENVSTINAASNAATNPPIADTTVDTKDGAVTIKHEAQPLDINFDNKSVWEK